MNNETLVEFLDKNPELKRFEKLAIAKELRLLRREIEKKILKKELEIIKLKDCVGPSHDPNWQGEL